jgi:glucose-6-phosphate isomerase
MQQTKRELWQRFQQQYRTYPTAQLAVDLSRVDCPPAFLQAMEKPLHAAFKAMEDLERGGMANPDEKRQVGHYWLRNPALAPTPKDRSDIEQAMREIKQFAEQIHRGGQFTELLLIGIGGSALGPQFVSQALSGLEKDPRQRLTLHCSDNTDPDGMDRLFSKLKDRLAQTLCVVISKSGGTPETTNGLRETQALYRAAGLDFAQHAVAITQKERSKSALFAEASDQRWLAVFPMWDWVGGRTSETSAVGLLPAALQGFDIDALLAGARACDELTRRHDFDANPAAQLALMWYFLGHGRGDKAMVVLPYKDRLELFSRYLQQLVMESLGKEQDLTERVVNQGLTVYGNKGSTDQHAYVQQLRDGLDNFFVTFIEVLQDRAGASPIVDEKLGATTGDFLSGFLLGTRQALFDKGRPSITVTLEAVTPFSIGVLIALFERAVGLYASLININAYHQPGVQAGKAAAKGVLELQQRLLAHLSAHRGQAFDVETLAVQTGTDQHPPDWETVFKTLERLAANPTRGIQKQLGGDVFSATYSLS